MNYENQIRIFGKSLHHIREVMFDEDAMGDELQEMLNLSHTLGEDMDEICE